MNSQNLKSRYLFFFIPLLLFTAACNTTKYLQEGQSYVVKNKIKFDSEEPIKNKRSLAAELPSLFKQKPNSRQLGFKTRLWAYYKTDDPGDTTKIDRWIRRTFAEPPVIYDEEIAAETAQSLKYFLQHKGYYDAEVSFEEERKHKKSTVTYIVDPNHLYTIDTVVYISKDTQIQQILTEIAPETHLKPGEPVSVDNYGKEVERINKTLKNRGYAYFDRNFVDDLKGDSSDYKVKLYLEVLTPSDKERHEVYEIGKITINPSYNPRKLQNNLKDTLIGGIHFLLDENNLVVKPQSIVRAVFLKEGDLYEQDNYTKTNRQLGNLEIYKFISIKPSRDTLGTGKINFNINLTPKKKLEAGAELEFSNSNFNSNNQRTSIIGTALNLSYKDRNFLRNASVLSTKLQGGVEFDFGNTSDILYSLDILAGGDWYIPKFVQFPGHFSIFKHFKFSEQWYASMREKAKTRVSGSYNRLLLFNFYNYHSFNGTFGWDFQPKPNTRFIINQIGINYLQPNTEEGFQQILDNNAFLARTFDKQLFTGFFFRDFSYIYNSRTDIFGRSWFFSSDVELSGTEMLLTNFAINGFNMSDTIRLFNQVDFSQYFRVELDGRHYIQFNKNHSLAFRLASSIGVPFGFSDGLPYVKQFFSGGPNSLRAWSIRELGPGRYKDPLTDDNPDRLPFYQAGDFKIEFNMEYRFNIFWKLKGAIFIDGGNIWTLKEDTSRVGSQLLWNDKFNEDGEQIGENFMKQIALGTGFGIRADFNYFVIRFDMGLKMRNNFRDEEGDYWLFKNWNSLALNRDFNPNLAIGFPF